MLNCYFVTFLCSLYSYSSCVKILFNLKVKYLLKLCFTLKVTNGSVGLCCDVSVSRLFCFVIPAVQCPSLSSRCRCHSCDRVRVDPEMNAGHRAPPWRGGAAPSCSDWPEKMFYGALWREAGQSRQPEGERLFRLTDRRASAARSYSVSAKGQFELTGC